MGVLINDENERKKKMSRKTILYQKYLLSLWLIRYEKQQ